MPRERIQVDAGPQAPIQKIVANPVDTYAKQSAGEQLAQLAQGLGEVSAPVQRLGLQLFQKGAEDSKQQGVEAARKLAEQGVTLAKGTREGKIPKTLNPFFNAGLQEQFGRTSADKWQSDFAAAVHGNAALQDPAVPPATAMQMFDQFAQQHMGDWMKQNVTDLGRTADFEKGFGFRSDAYMADARRQFAATLEHRLDTTAYEALFSETKRHVAQYGAQLDPDLVASDINSLTQSRYSQGLRGDIINKAVTDAVVAAAKEQPELGQKILSVLQHTKSGSGSIADTAYASKTVEDANKEITDRLFINQQRDHDLANQRREDATRKIQTSYFAQLAKDPTADPAKAVQSLIRIGAGDKAQALVDARRAANDLRYSTDEGVKNDLYARIEVPGNGPPVDESQVIAQQAQKKLTVIDANWLIEKLKQTRDGNEKKIYDDFNFKQELENIKFRLGDPVAGIVKGELGDRVAYAQAQFRDAWTQANAAGSVQKMAPQEKVKWLSETADEIVKRERGPDAFTVKPAPKPAYVQDRAEIEKRVQSLVLSESDLAAARTGRVTPTVEAAMRRLGLDASMTGAFVQRQTQLFQKQNGREPKPAEVK